MNQAPGGSNIIEEIESVGNQQRFAVEANLLQALISVLNAKAWPSSPLVPQWQAEARVFRTNAQSRSVPSMRQRLDLVRIYRRACRGVPDTIDGQPPLPMPEVWPPEVWPLTLDELLREDEAPHTGSSAVSHTGNSPVAMHCCGTAAPSLGFRLEAECLPT